MSEFHSNNNGENNRYNNSNNQISVSTSMLTICDSTTAAQLKLSISSIYYFIEQKPNLY